MAEFFDRRAHGYDAHMRNTLGESFDDYYEGAAQPVARTDQAIRALNLGVGTDLELIALWERAPQALVTGIDVSGGMLQHLQEKYREAGHRLALVQADYLEHPLAYGWDYIMSVMSLHHLTPARKGELHSRVCATLKPGGRYIEADYVVDTEQERYLSEQLGRCSASMASNGYHHIDVPLSLSTQRRLLGGAGFSRVQVTWHQGEAAIVMADKTL